ncbi:MAG: hypothetical protein VX829_04065 [Pseudomonadota bacterium]|uniref:hypothetical protein n=1 Tax=Methylophaga aminisulfidivorans TaxID=230105 RepID=UPI0024E22BAE|nr:hypothetical protein [Methylophaga aminisulfidivorans]MEC9411835.1 hypothetical protein [Pseudomonadota bacterium]
MGGLGILLIIVFYIALTVFLLIKAKSMMAKLLMFIIAILLPTADAVYGRYKLKQMCGSEGGLKIYHVANNVKGFMGYANVDMIKKYGYDYVEECHYKSICYGYYKDGGEIVRKDDISPKSKYLIKKEFELKNGKYGYQKYLIEDIKLQNILATDTQLVFMGGWAEQFLGKFTGAGGGNVALCESSPDVLVRIENLISKTLLP